MNRFSKITILTEGIRVYENYVGKIHGHLELEKYKALTFDSRS